MKKKNFVLLFFVSGIFLFYVSCASTPSSEIVEEEEPSLISEAQLEELETFENFEDQFTQAAEQSVVGNYIGAEAQAKIIVYFDFDSAFLALDGRKALDGIITEIKNRLEQNIQPTNIRIEGHTDERGSNEYNLALGQRRADSVARYMMLQGLLVEQLEVVSYGETSPVRTDSGEIAWQENRRVEINY